MTGAETQAKLRAYATEFIRGYNDAVERNYPNAKLAASQIDFIPILFPLVSRELGRDVALAVLHTPNDLYIFFLHGEGQDILVLKETGEAEGFGADWTYNTPDEKRMKRVRNYLGLTDEPVFDDVNIPGGQDFLTFDIAHIEGQGYAHGIGRGNKDGRTAERQLPEIFWGCPQIPPGDRVPKALSRTAAVHTDRATPRTAFRGLVARCAGLLWLETEEDQDTR
jgi:hypothetical protein